MKTSVKQAMEILGRLEQSERIFIWVRSKTDVEDNYGVSITDSQWEKIDENCELIDDLVEDGVMLLAEEVLGVSLSH